ncbi:MAG: hypothetical protein J6Y64_08135 [Ruminococcus sp.]|nr:hypothetical protein [Ruminococcus sp.]
MKNTIKKVICTTLAAVSLSALVAVPSALNNPASDSSLVHIVEADAANALKYFNCNFLYAPDGKNYNSTAYDFKLLKDLNARKTPDGNIIKKYKKGSVVRICTIRYEEYTKKEFRVWGYSATESAWFCLNRTYCGPENPWPWTEDQAECIHKTYGKDITTFLNLASNQANEQIFDNLKKNPAIKVHPYKNLLGLHVDFDIEKN